MNRLFSLIKASMTDGMRLFSYGKRNRGGKKAGKGLPIVLVLVIGLAVMGYAEMLLDPLVETGMGFVMLTLFVLITSILTFVEGIYKSGSLLFNCRDDDLMFSLPIKKSTVLFVRIFKLYVFELLYNALFLVPAMITYALRVEVDGTFFLSSLVAVIFLPVIPIVVVCVIGGVVASVSSKFRFKNVVQIILITLVLLGVLFMVWNLDAVLANIAEHASSINDLITRLYYPAGAYIGMVTDFKISELLIFVLSNMLIFGVTILALGKIYFKINSKAKITKTIKHKTKYEIKKTGVTRAIIRKELKKFINTPVFVVNAAFGLVLYVVGCLVVCLNADALAGAIAGIGVEMSFDLSQIITNYAPLILLGLIFMGSLMSSITSSMISLEGKSFNILKSVPVRPSKILGAKVLTAVLVMLPFIITGDVIMFLRFEFSILEMVLCIIASVIAPIVAEMIGIIVNLKYPKMDATSDAEVVKQSTSSFVATFLGMGLLILSIFGIMKLAQFDVSMEIILAGGVGIYAVAMVGLMWYIRTIGIKKFLAIDA